VGLFETKVWRNKTALIVQQIISIYFDKIQEIFKGLGSLTNNFCPANFEKIILQRASKCFNYYKI